MVSVPLPGVSVKLWPYKLTVPSTLFRPASALVVPPVVNVPETLSPAPLGTSVIPLFKRSRLAPFPILRVPATSVRLWPGELVTASKVKAPLLLGRQGLSEGLQVQRVLSVQFPEPFDQVAVKFWASVPAVRMISFAW